MKGKLKPQVNFKMINMAVKENLLDEDFFSPNIKPKTSFLNLKNLLKLDLDLNVDKMFVHILRF